jgi:hypothetical protein
MRFLDLDLDFFLNKNAYAHGHIQGRLGPDYEPWSVYRVQRFLETRCALSPFARVPGRIVKNHDEVLQFWRLLIKSGRLTVPFDVVHVDAHPDIWVGGGLYMTPGYLHVQPERELTILKKKPVHEGNFLTFALARGWVGSLVWVPLVKHGKEQPPWDGDARAVREKLKGRKGGTPPVGGTLAGIKEIDIPYEILPWNKFLAAEAFDDMALSRSPGFTPPSSDGLVAVIERYMETI